MKVLFVSSGNLATEISPIISSQAVSLISKGIDIAHFTIKGRGLRGYLKSVPALREKLKSERFSVIHSHFGYCGIVSHLAKMDQAHVVSFMGDDLLSTKDEEGHTTLKGRTATAINQWFAEHKYDYNIVKTEEMRSRLNCQNVMVIPNGVSFEKFKPADKLESRAQLGLDMDSKYVLFVSDPKVEAKNYLLAEQAIKLLSKEIPVELLAVHGKTQEELCHHYNAVDTLILTSFHEGSPNVVKEAMACNTPVVATSVGDVKQVISGTAGCFVATFKAKDVAKALKSSLEYGKATNGRDNIRHLESGVIADKIIGLYKGLVNN